MNTSENANKQIQRKPLRLWPGVVIVLLQWFLRFGLPVFIPDAIIIGVFGALILGLAIIVWWAFFSRAPRFERWSAIVMMIIALIVTSLFIDKSIATSMMGMMFAVYSIPILCLAFILWAVACSNLPDKPRRAIMFATIFISVGFWVCLRSNGMYGDVHFDLGWRWAKTSEELFISKQNEELIIIPFDSTFMTKEAEWSGFRGNQRDGIVHGVKIGTDWVKSPPVEVWRRPVGPGCSSFAVQGNLLYTQEQRGEYEMVTCYLLNSGEPVWRHSDSTRFWDSHAGAGPRSTPALSHGRVYALGATGILNALDARTGAVVWSRNAAKEAKVKIPGWGYSGSPLVDDSIVFVAIAGKLIAYNVATGKQSWSGTDGGESYSSTHLMTINGIKQVVFMSNEGTTGFEPTHGTVLWKHQGSGARIVQPASVSESDILVDQGDRKGIQRITFKNKSGGLKPEIVWTTSNLRPDFNDYVVHKGYIYGFNGSGLECIDVEKGNHKWKGGRYGGQLLLLADQDLLLILSEKGDIVLVKATPEQFNELARFPAIKGRTWNHPVLVGDLLVVRNSEEMAAFRLPAPGKPKN